MKKSTLTLMVLVVFAMSAFGLETNSKKNLFAGFDGIELTSQEASLITGGETYLGGTKVMGTKYIHSLIVVTDKPIEDPTFQVDAVFESGPEHSVIKSSSSSLGFGNNVQQHYNSPEEIKANPKKYNFQQVIPPEGMDISDYDELVKSTGKAFFQEKPKKYVIKKNSCNTSAAIIIHRTNGYVEPSGTRPGWIY